MRAPGGAQPTGARRDRGPRRRARSRARARGDGRPRAGAGGAAAPPMRSRGAAGRGRPRHRRYERLPPTQGAEDGCVHGRRRGEGSAVDAPRNGKLVPGAPVTGELRGRPHARTLLGEPPLHDRVDSADGDGGIVEEPAKEGGSRRERQVGDNGERLMRERDACRVAVHDADVGEPAAKPGGEIAVELDRDDTRAAASSAAVTIPRPAPRSSTRSPRSTRAQRTRSSASARLRSACRPRVGTRAPATEDHHRRHRRDSTTARR